MADAVTGLVNEILKNLPAGANPWTAIRRTFSAQVRPTLEPSFRAQLYTCSAIIAAMTVILILCMAAKFRQRNYWLVRTRRGTGGTYLVVHYASAWTTTIIVFFGVLQGYLWETVMYSLGDWVPNSDLWRMCVWYPGWLAFWFAAWSLRVSHILHLDSSGRPSRSFLSQAWFVNAGAVVIAILAAVVIAILSWQAHRRYTQAMALFALIDAALGAAEASYSGTFDMSLFQNGPGLSLAVTFTGLLASFGKYFRWVFWAYFIFTVLLEVVLIVTAVLHLRELRHTMNDLRGRAHQSEEARLQEEMIETGYKGLRNITYAIVACCTAVNILFAYVGIAGRSVIYEKSYSEVASLLPLWLFSLLGLPLSILFLRRIVENAPPRDGSSSAAQEEGPSTSVHVRANASSHPSTSADKQVPTPADEYAMSSLGQFAVQPPAGDFAMTSMGSVASQPTVKDEYSSVRHDSPTLSAGSGAQLVSPPGAEQPFYASYETRAPASVEDGGQVGQSGGGKWAKKLGGRK